MECAHLRLLAFSCLATMAVPLSAQQETVGDDAVTAAATDSAADAPTAEGATPEVTRIESAVDAKQAVARLTDEASVKSQQAVEALAAGDLSTAAGQGLGLLLTFGLPAVTALLVIILAYFMAKFLARVASRPVRDRVDETLGRFVGKAVYYLVMLCSVLGVLQYFGIGISSFAAVIAAAGFAVGLAFQGTLSNFAAGIMLLVFRPFKVGDVINAAGITAKVYEIDLFNTIFDTPDNRRIIVPNSAISSGTIENISHHSQRRVDVNVGVDYTASLDETRQVLTAAAETLREKLIDGEGRGVQIVLVDLGDCAVNWTIRFWTQADEFWAVKEQLTHAVKTKLDEAGIGIPFPQLDVHLRKGDE